MRHRAVRLTGSLAGAVMSVGLVSTVLATPAQAFGDDYPYRYQGTCPLVEVPVGPVAGRASTGAQTRLVQDCTQSRWIINGSAADPWGFILRNCTSFVAWRLTHDNGMADFHNRMRGGHFGDAKQWDENAFSLGYLVDDVPAIGAVAQTDAGTYGHVAYVTAIGKDTVTVEEYNHVTRGGYSVRTVPTSDFRYLHLRDVAPAPYVGSARPAVTTTDDAGTAWTATVGRRLVVSDDAGRRKAFGGPGSWSPTASPAIAVDSRGRAWVAGVRRDGTLMAARTRRNGGWTDLRTVDRTEVSRRSTPVLVRDAADRMRLFAVAQRGHLVEWRTQPGRTAWDQRARVGRRHSWATGVSPSVTQDHHDRLWLSGVTPEGALLVTRSTRDGHGWQLPLDVEWRMWSGWSSPTLATDGEGRVWLHAVTANGQLWSHHTDRDARDLGRAEHVPGFWSPWSSPASAVAEDGRVWVAATTLRGGLEVASTSRDTARLRGFVPASGSWSEVDNPSLALADGEVVVTTGAEAWRRVAPLTPAAD